MSAEYLGTFAIESQVTSGLKDARFLMGHHEPRVAFVGRSNVGKSSLINALLNHKIAFASKKPGKTRTINFFKWNEGERIFVDLPGYGFASRSHDEQGNWEKLMDSYFETEGALLALLLLLDARHGPTQSDLDAHAYFSGKGLNVVWVMTKSDLLKNQSERARRKREVAQAAARHGIDEGALFWVSSTEKPSIKALERLILSAKLE